MEVSGCAVQACCCYDYALSHRSTAPPLGADAMRNGIRFRSLREERESFSAAERCFMEFYVNWLINPNFIISAAVQS